MLDTPVLTDGTEITPFNFTKGNDDWDPFAILNVQNPVNFQNNLGVNIVAYKDTVKLSNVTSNVQVNVYSLTGQLVKSFKTNQDTSFTMQQGFWIVTIDSQNSRKSVKLITY